jgi:large subunit ribosomal protein L15
LNEDFAAMIIDDVHRGIRKNRTRKRLGRGPGSGLGKTSGRGHKGAGSRAGYSARLGFEGGQMPLARRVAKRGFNNKFFSTKVAIVNLATLEEVFETGGVIDPEALQSSGVIKGQYEAIKILGDGELTKKFTVKAHRFSQSAAQKIVAAGGQVEKIGLA